MLAGGHNAACFLHAALLSVCIVAFFVTWHHIWCPPKRYTLVVVSHLDHAVWLLWQVADLTQYGNAIEVAKLLLPRGSKLLAASTQQVELPTRSTPLGDVAVPPKTYFM